MTFNLDRSNQPNHRTDWAVRMWEVDLSSHTQPNVRIDPGSASDWHLALGRCGSVGVPPDECTERVGMVFQKPSPFPKSIFDNVAYGLRVNRLAKSSEIGDLVEEISKELPSGARSKTSCMNRLFPFWGQQQRSLHRPRLGC